MNKEIDFGSMVELQVILNRLTNILETEKLHSIAIYVAPFGFESARLGYPTDNGFEELVLRKEPCKEGYKIEYERTENGNKI